MTESTTYKVGKYTVMATSVNEPTQEAAEAFNKAVHHITDKR